MNVMPYRILLEEPLLAAALEGDPNSAETLHYIPGSVLRGALLAAYLRQQKLAALDAGDETARELFFSGTTRFLNAYPVVNGRRALPAPLSWYKEKGKDDSEVLDATLFDLDKDKRQWKAVSGGRPTFVTVNAAMGEESAAEEGEFVKGETRLNVAVHTARVRRYGRPRGQVTRGEEDDQGAVFRYGRPRGQTARGEEDDQGAVFRYVSLAAGQEFEAVVISDSPRAAQVLQPLLSGRAWLGGSRSAGYGKVTLSAAPPPPQPWRECAPLQDGADHVPPPGIFTLTFLSDGLFRNEYGQWAVTPEVVCGALSQALGCKVEPVQDQAFLGAVLTGGFNRKWGLPLPQAQAVRMGSVLVVRAPGCTVQALQKLEQDGLGERRTEGFGRVAVNWLENTTWKLKEPKARPVQVPSLAPGSIDEAAAQQAAQRLLRARLEAALVTRSNELASAVSGVSASQLNALIEVFQTARRKGLAQGQPDLQKLLGEINRDFYGRARVEGRPLLDWLKERAAGGQEIWDKLGVGFPRVGGVKAKPSAAMAFELNLRLAIAVLARAVKMISRQ